MSNVSLQMKPMFYRTRASVGDSYYLKAEVVMHEGVPVMSLSVVLEKMGTSVFNKKYDHIKHGYIEEILMEFARQAAEFMTKYFSGKSPFELALIKLGFEPNG